MATRKACCLLLVAGACVTFSSALAGQTPLNGGKICTIPKTYYINEWMPIEGDAPTNRAHQTWNNVGSKMTYVYGGLTTLVPDGQEQSETVIDYYEMWDNNSTDWLMRAVLRRYTGQNCWFINYILVNDETLFANEFSFGTTKEAGKWDYESAMLHEMGHHLGLEHETNSTYSSSVMWDGLSASDVKRSPTTRDKNSVLSIYGTR